MIYVILLCNLLMAYHITADQTLPQQKKTEKKTVHYVSDDEFEEYILHDTSLDKEPESLRAPSWPGSYYFKWFGSVLFVKFMALHERISNWWPKNDADE